MAENKEQLDQSVCVVYEYSNFDEPVLRRINKHCVWKSDGMTVRIDSEGLTIREDNIPELRHWPYSQIRCAVIGNNIKAGEVCMVDSQRFLLAISRKFSDELLLDGRKYVRNGNLDWKPI